MSGVKRRPCGPVRQLSLQATSTSTSTYLPGGVSLAARRNQLRKQSSEDIWHSGSPGAPPLICVGGSRGTTPPVTRTRPPPVRLAWTEPRRNCGPSQVETSADPPKVEVEVVARKCALPQARTRLPPKLASTNQQQEALDGSRLRLAERLRMAWQQSNSPAPNAPAPTPARTNLDIFLAHNSNNANVSATPTTNCDNQVTATVTTTTVAAAAIMIGENCSTKLVTAQNCIRVEKEEEEEEGVVLDDEELRSRSFGAPKSGTEGCVGEGRKSDDGGGVGMLMNNKDKEMKEGKSICISITDRVGGKFSDSEEEGDDEGGIVRQRLLKNSRCRNVSRGGTGSMTSSPDLVAAKKGEPFPGTPSASRSSTPAGRLPEQPRRLMSAPPQSIPPRRPASQQERSSPLVQTAAVGRRKLKSARRKQQKPAGVEDDISSGEDVEQKPRRSRSARTSEVITMVSLLSPGQSEQEEEGECVTMVLGATTTTTTMAAGDQHSPWQDGGLQSKMATSGANCSPASAGNPVAASPFLNGSAANPILCIRKPVKTVSFQQQSGGRSYANNFPSRRGAAILPPEEEFHNPAPPPLRSTSLVAGGGARSGGGEATPTAALKRKLVRATSSNEAALPPQHISNEPNEDIPSSTTRNMPQPIEIVLTPAKTTPSEANKINRTLVDAKEQNKVVENGGEHENDEEEEEEEETDDIPQFKTPKEQECWDLFRRMVDKGITVSFETVLRGMLTPTEYRLRRHNLLSS